jgi:outer membrane protein assembly factor BamB
MIAVFASVLAAIVLALNTFASDQPQWGEKFSRNMVSAERGLLDKFDIRTGENVRWTARLGTESYSTPVVAGGKVFIGTNNGDPRDPRHQGDRGVLMCFDERDGRLLWQLVVPKRSEDPYYDWPKSGISSSATVEGDRVYIVSNRGEVLCLDAEGLSNGNDGPYRDEGIHMTPKGEPKLEPGDLDADILWVFDMVESAGIWPHDAAHSSIMIDGDLLYLNTGTGVDNTHKRIRTPDAPSLIVLDKRSGKLLAREREHIAPNIFHCTWSSPSKGLVTGESLIFFAAGNGVVYAFEPLQPGSGDEIQTLKKVWSFDCDPAAPKENVHRYNLNRREGPSNIYGMPVFYKDRVYVAGGGDLFWGKNTAWFQCIKATGAGNVTSNALVWSYPLERHTISTPAIWRDLAFIADCGRMVHCINAETGKPYWTHETQGEIWASPMVADGKVFIGTRRGDFWMLAADREKKVVFSANVGAPISATAVAANTTLYVATMTNLYALAQKEESVTP